jgi:CheY-like chemotaxis protein
MVDAEGSPEIAAKSILVVEDEVFVRIDVAMSLENEGYRVTQAANAEEALAVLQTQTPVHLMLTDVSMPGLIDGLQLAAQVRTQWPGVKIVLMSAHIVELPSGGSIDASVGKPFLMGKILECFDRLLGTSADAAQSSGDVEPQQSLVDAVVATVTGADPAPETA